MAEKWINILSTQEPLAYELIRQRIICPIEKQAKNINRKFTKKCKLPLKIEIMLKLLSSQM